MTKEIMKQYEAVRRSGRCNMFNYYRVVGVAKQIKFKELSKLSLKEYEDVLTNFDKYMKQFNIKQ